MSPLATGIGLAITSEVRTISAEGPARLQFALNGFTEVNGFRVFEFEGISSDWTRTVYTVETDLAMTRRYGIRLQELPLLCRAMLDRDCGESQAKRAFTYSEQEMSAFASCAKERSDAAKFKKGPRTNKAPAAESNKEHQID